jgi:hypothetical protein
MQLITVHHLVRSVVLKTNIQSVRKSVLYDDAHGFMSLFLTLGSNSRPTLLLITLDTRGRLVVSLVKRSITAFLNGMLL